MICEDWDSQLAACVAEFGLTSTECRAIVEEMATECDDIVDTA